MMIQNIVIFLLLYVCSMSSISLNSFDYMACGGLATAITDALLYPIDTIKVKQQSSRIPIQAFQACNDIVSSYGIKGFYRGVIGYSFIDGIGASIFFTVYENIKDKINSCNVNPFSPYFSAASAFLVSSSFMVPAELIKVKMQSKPFKNIETCINHLWKSDNRGIRGLYKGYGATVLRDLPYFCLQLGCYDNIRTSLENIRVKYNVTSDGLSDTSTKLRKLLNHMNWMFQPHNIDLVSSLAAGTITGILTNPMDVVTARLMTQQPSVASLNPLLDLLGSEIPSATNKIASNVIKEIPQVIEQTAAATATICNSLHQIPYKGVGDCIIRMAKEEGVGSFFAGAKARVIWIAPFTAASLCLNEAFRREIIRRKQLHQTRILENK